MAGVATARSMAGSVPRGPLRRCVLSDVNGAPSGLRRNVGLTSLMFISLGSIIGSGWLLGALTAAPPASRTASPVSRWACSLEKSFDSCLLYTSDAADD